MKPTSDGTFIVSAEGDTKTTKGNVSKYLLYACCDLTIEREFKYFEVLDQSTDRYQHLLFPEYTVSVIIRMFNDKPEKMTDNIYNAKRQSMKKQRETGDFYIIVNTFE